MEFKQGYYEVFGNLVEYDGDIAYDIDANEEIPVEVVIAVGDYLGEDLDEIRGK